MRTSDPAIYALGECVEVNGQRFGLVAPLYDMANVLAAQLCGDETATFTPVATATRLKVTGINLYSAGDFAEGDDREEIVLRDATAGVYKRLILKDDKIIGTVLYGDTGDGPWFYDMLKRSVDTREMRDTLIFGQNYQGGAPLDPTAAVAALPDEAEICGCNGVCKSKITGAITGKGLTSLDDVRAHTKASASCGSCTGLVEKLLLLTLGDSYNPAAVQPMCKCTDLGHDDVRRLIVAKGLRSIPQLMQELEWKTSCGCAKCRPALNYYLIATWPGEYEDDGQSPLHQRARPRQHPEGRHLFGGAAHVGRPDQPEGTARHRRRRRQVQDPDGQGDRRAAHRPARGEEGRPARRLGRSQRRRHGFRRRLRQGAAHGEDLRRLGLVPLRHAGFDRARHRSKSSCGAAGPRPR